MTAPLFDTSIVAPSKMTMPSVVGGGIDGGVNQVGISQTLDFTGGLVTVTYSGIALRAVDPKYARAWSRYQAILNGGSLAMRVPLLVNFYQPVYDQYAAPILYTWDDGTIWDDGTEWEEGSADSSCSFGASAAVNAAQITVHAGSRIFTGGEVLGVIHATKLDRAYFVREIVSSSQVGGSNVYVVKIRPNLREAVNAGDTINLDNPTCMMKLPAGKTLSAELDNFNRGRPDVTFIEAFYGY